MEEMQERKRGKYAPLVTECRRLGWKAHCEPIEVDCRGFAGGAPGSGTHRNLWAAESPGHQEHLGRPKKASGWLWIKRGDK